MEENGESARITAMRDNTNPNEVKTFTDGEAKLYTGRSINIGADVIVPADYMVVEDSIGTEDEVLVFTHDGARRVLNVRQTLEIHSSSPAVDASVTSGVKLEPTEPEREQRLLKIYDLFQVRTCR